MEFEEEKFEITEQAIERCPHCKRGYYWEDMEEIFCENDEPDTEEKVECDNCGKYFLMHRAFLPYFEAEEIEEE